MQQNIIVSITKVVLTVMLTSIMYEGQSVAATYYLRAGTTAKTLTDGNTVTMWGFARDSASGANDGTVTVPGPTLTVSPDDPILTIQLQNTLAEPVSLVIPSQIASMTPVRNGGGRMRSLTAETAPGAIGTYTWTAFKSGSYVYLSSTHQSVQVQMGLYGPVTKDFATDEAYPGVPYQHQASLFFSEIDPALHAAVASGNYGAGKPMTSTIGYDPHYFLINGEVFSPLTTASIFAGRPEETSLIRFFNAGLETHIPVLQGLNPSVVAEDGNKYSYPPKQYSVDLYALKTVDLIATPETKGDYPVYDRRLHLTNATASPGGMLSFLKFVPPLAIETNSEVAKGGDLFSLDAKLSKNITGPYDLYIILETPSYGLFTVSLDGSLSTGIKRIARGPYLTAPIWWTIWSSTRVPVGIASGVYTFYIAAVNAGTIPPVSSLSQLNAHTPNVIYFDKTLVEVQ